MEQEVAQKKVSKYNSADYLNLALHALWQEARNHARKGDFNSWKKDLDMIWCELGSDVDADSDEEKQFNKINNQIISLSAFQSPIVSGFSKINKDQQRKNDLLYLKLLELHIWLKRLQNATGKGTAYADPDEDSID